MAHFVHVFDCLETADVDNYDPNMQINPEIGDGSPREAIFESRKARFLLVSTADRSARLFIISIVEEKWFSELKDANTYFNNMLAKVVLGHFANTYDGLYDTDAVDIHLSMPSW